MTLVINPLAYDIFSRLQQVDPLHIDQEAVGFDALTLVKAGG